MEIFPVHFAQANNLVEHWHRHHGRVVGYKFAVGVREYLDENKIEAIRGVAICGRPVARNSDDGETLEVVRLATDGTKNACSMLYGACARIAKEMGYRRILTFTLESEPGISLKASGWKFSGITPGKSWSVPSRERVDKHPLVPKKRWILELKKSI